MLKHLPKILLLFLLSLCVYEIVSLFKTKKNKQTGILTLASFFVFFFLFFVSIAHLVMLHINGSFQLTLNKKLRAYLSALFLILCIDVIWLLIPIQTFTNNVISRIIFILIAFKMLINPRLNRDKRDLEFIKKLYETEGELTLEFHKKLETLENIENQNSNKEKIKDTFETIVNKANKTKNEIITDVIHSDESFSGTQKHYNKNVKGIDLDPFTDQEREKFQQQVDDQGQITIHLNDLSDEQKEHIVKFVGIKDDYDEYTDKYDKQDKGQIEKKDEHDKQDETQIEAARVKSKIEEEKKHNDGKQDKVPMEKKDEPPIDGKKDEPPIDVYTEETNMWADKIFEYLNSPTHKLWVNETFGLISPDALLKILRKITKSGTVALINFRSGDLRDNYKAFVNRLDELKDDTLKAQCLALEEHLFKKTVFVYDITSDEKSADIVKEYTDFKVIIGNNNADFKPHDIYDMVDLFIFPWVHHNDIKQWIHLLNLIDFRFAKIVIVALNVQDDIEDSNRHFILAFENMDTRDLDRLKTLAKMEKLFTDKKLKFLDRQFDFKGMIDVKKNENRFIDQRLDLMFGERGNVFNA